MPKFSRGRDSEDRLCTLLTNYGCQLLINEVLDHKHKLDFVVLQFPEFSRLLQPPIGVQTTNNLNDLKKQADFLAIVKKNPYTPRNIFLEWSEQVNLEEGGAFIVMVAFMNVAFNKDYANHKIVGVYLETDLTYSIYDLEEALKKTGTSAVPETGHVEKRAFSPLGSGLKASTTQPRVEGKAPKAPSPVLTSTERQGVIQRYNRVLKIGEILSVTGEMYFLHRGNIADQAVLDEMEALAEIDDKLTPPINVSFIDGGRPEGKKNPVAKDIVRRKQ